MPRAGRRWSTIVAWVAAVVAMSTAAGGAHAAAERDSPQAERERVRSQRATLASELDALRASDAEVSAALTDLGANVADQRALLQDAQRRADQAAADQEMARAEEGRAVAEVAALEDKARDRAVQEFMRPSEADVDAFLSAGSPGDGVRRHALLSFTTRRDDDILDQLRAGREDLAVRREEAEKATARAEAERGEVGGRLATLEQAQAQQQEFADSVEQRLDAALAEAAALEALDRRLADQIAAEQARLAAEVARARGAGRARSGPAGGRSVRATSAGGIVSVRGIQVSSEIAEELEALLAAADADGVALSGGGYRDPSAQVALRRANCGASDYAVYDMGPSQCRPPTARPGSSMHERGLAVDFTYNGSLINSRSNPGFRWLEANAAGFGFYNLPSEPWHWSSNGQ